MKLYNTLSGKKEDFSTADGKVRMYVCGITPYSASHIGHAMFVVIFDVVRRYLEFKGFDVKHVQNFTDIDDKMIQAAAQMGISTQELADRNIDQYMTEMERLNALPAHLYPRATEEMPKIIEMITKLLEQGSAYSVNGDVYFRVRAHEEYGKLSHRTLEGMKAGARLEIDESKEDVMDFALWKSQKPGEPAWDSPFGTGRPGWHIECSAMSAEYLGETLDIHGGGSDLVFPHHENELAQTEAYSSVRPFVRFWLHNGVLRMGEDKMSKSLGNIVSVEEALEKYSSDALRLFFLSSHYRSPLVYNERNVEAQERAAERLRVALRPSPETDGGTSLDAADFRGRFVDAMDDDLNTPRALAAMFDLAREINRARDERCDLSRAQEVLRELAGVFGLVLEVRDLHRQTDISPFVDLLIDVRADLRRVKQFDLADKIRDQLDCLGVAIEDTSGGTQWRAQSGG
jgi:cysteinyl-tRNA synthetase